MIYFFIVILRISPLKVPLYMYRVLFSLDIDVLLLVDGDVVGREVDEQRGRVAVAVLAHRDVRAALAQLDLHVQPAVLRAGAGQRVAGQGTGTVGLTWFGHVFLHSECGIRQIKIFTCL